LLKLQGRTAVVTGAAGGIGRGIASALARRGCHLALADVDDAALAHTVAEISAQGAQVSRHHLDVADRSAVAEFPDRVTAEHSSVDILVNNAGVALAGTFEQVDEADFEWLININFWGVVRMTRAFLPLLHNSEEARIVNLSSIFGMIAPPGNTA
jgi:NAD(P)-dependent dehydrogenase (short-subunit alcohol dehydrogenase family)